MGWTMIDERWARCPFLGHRSSRIHFRSSFISHRLFLILEKVSTMPVVKIPTPLRPHANGLDSVDTTGSTVGEVLGQVFEQHPGLKERIFDGTELRRFVNV